jgi:predicted transcriptional regulator
MPYDKQTHTTLTVVMPKKTKLKFQELAKNNLRTPSAHALFLINKAIEEEENRSKK